MEGESRKGLYYFSVLAETLSFTNASKLLYISQQALSKQIQALEREYGTELLERKPRVRLTEAGQRVLEHYRRIRTEEVSLRMELQELSGELTKRTISACLVENRAQILLPDLLRLFRPEEKRAICSFVTSGYTTAKALLQTGGIDLYFGLLESCMEYGNRYALISEHPYLLLPQSFLRRLPLPIRQKLPELARKGVSLEQVLSWRLPWVMPGPVQLLWPEYTRAFSALDYNPEVFCNAYPFETALLLSRMGMGTAIVSQTALYSSVEQLRNGDLIILPLQLMGPPFTLGMVTTPQAKHDMFLQSYIDCALAAAKQISGEIDQFIREYCDMQFSRT